MVKRLLICLLSCFHGLFALATYLLYYTKIHLSMGFLKINIRVADGGINAKLTWHIGAPFNRDLTCVLVRCA